MARNRCNRLIQLSHQVDEDAAGKYFRFDGLVGRMEPNGARAAGATGRNVVAVGDVRRESRYPRTMESFETFQTGAFAGTVHADLQRVRGLEGLR